MPTEKRLGRGLGSLLGGPSTPDPELPRAEVPLAEIRPNPFQPRKTFDASALEELAASIRRHGILQPLVLRALPAGYQLIAGERRLRAAQLAGLTQVPAVILRDVSDDQMLELALVENVQRADLDAIEKGRGYGQLIERLGLTQDQVAERVGLKRSTIANHLRLLDLPAEAQQAVAQGVISMGHARALLAVPAHSRVLELIQRIVREDLSVRALEKLVRETQAASSKSRSAAGQKDAVRPPWVVELEGRMREHLGTKVRLENQPGHQGRIIIEYFDRGDLERLAALLAPRRSL